MLFVRRLLSCTQQLKAKREELSAASGGQETKVPDTHEALWKQVQQKAGQEFIDGQGQQLLFVVVSGITQRKVTWPSAKETRRWLEMATRWV